jgi:23S rRNA (guanosine2251-2'-O)-methyltransferase
MDEPSHFIYRCMRPSCKFRFPQQNNFANINKCPKCGGPIEVTSFHESSLKTSQPTSRVSGLIIQVLLDNIRSAYNVGSIFRTADGAGVDHIYICGVTPTPDHPKVAKTALGAEHSIPWTQTWDALETADELKQQGYQLWALEACPTADSLFDTLSYQSNSPVLLIIGNEVAGIDPQILDLCHRTVFIPMYGFKQSLNVAIAFGVAVYTIRQAFR